LFRAVLRSAARPELRHHLLVELFEGFLREYAARYGSLPHA
jgi:hypothetical protein